MSINLMLPFLCNPVLNSSDSPISCLCLDGTAAFLFPALAIVLPSVILMSRSLQDAVTTGNVDEGEVRLNMGEDVNDSFAPRCQIGTLFISFHVFI